MEGKWWLLLIVFVLVIIGLLALGIILPAMNRREEEYDD